MPHRRLKIEAGCSSSKAVWCNASSHVSHSLFPDETILVSTLEYMNTRINNGFMTILPAEWNQQELASRNSEEQEYTEAISRFIRILRVIRRWQSYAFSLERIESKLESTFETGVKIGCKESDKKSKKGMRRSTNWNWTFSLFYQYQLNPTNSKNKNGQNNTRDWNLVGQINHWTFNLNTNPPEIRYVMFPLSHSVQQIDMQRLPLYQTSIMHVAVSWNLASHFHVSQQRDLFRTKSNKIEPPNSNQGYETGGNWLNERREVKRRPLEPRSRESTSVCWVRSSNNSNRPLSGKDSLEHNEDQIRISFVNQAEFVTTGGYDFQPAQIH